MQPWLDLIPPAYLDPGTGSYALQLLMAGLFGGLFVLKQSWSDLKLWASARLGGNPGARASSPPGPGRDGARSSHTRNARHHARTAAEPR